MIFHYVALLPSLAQVFVRSVMSLYEGAKTRVRMDSKL